MRNLPKLTGYVTVMLIVSMMAAPLAIADHAPDYDDGSGPQALDDVASDGYVIVSEQTDNGFEVQAFHADDLGLATGDALDLREPGGNAGAWLHDLDDTGGFQPAQDVSLNEDGDALLVENIDAEGVFSVSFVVPIDAGQGWLGGLHNSVPVEHDAGDAVFEPVEL